MIKLEFKSDIFKSFDKSTFLLILFYNFSYNFFFIYIKMSKNLSAKYYQENKERLQKKSRKRYQNLSKEEKGKKQQYGRERYKNLSEEKKQKLVEYRKKILQNEKKIYIIIIRKYFNSENLTSL